MSKAVESRYDRIRRERDGSYKQRQPDGTIRWFVVETSFYPQMQSYIMDKVDLDTLPDDSTRRRISDDELATLEKWL